VSRYDDPKLQIAYEKGYNTGMDRAREWVRWMAHHENMEALVFIRRSSPNSAR
jgi:hypothetical protein